jgi:hypothetical protein
MRALATNSSARRLASSTRSFHCSRVSAEAGKSSSSWLKQHAANPTSDQTTTAVVVQIVMTWALRVRASPQWDDLAIYYRHE